MTDSLSGKHVAITGPTAGIGRHSALELATRGASLTLFCRDEQKAEPLRQDIVAVSGSSPKVIIMDMADLSSVRRAAKAFIDLGQPLDILLNNAGLINTSRRQTVDGFEETLAVNHFAPFLLTGMLLPALRQAPAARIVNVASDAHRYVKDMAFEDMQADKGYRTFREYGRSKLANILFTRSLAKRLEGENITVNCLHPGAVATSLGKNNPGLTGKLLPALLKPFFRSPEQGAETSIYLCCSEDVSDISGEYFSDCKVSRPKACALDVQAAEQLWKYTEEQTGFRYPQ